MQRTRGAVACLEQRGVDAPITGSLADGTSQLHSDVDLRIVHCPRGHKYAIEGLVEDAMQNIPFDVVYLDKILPRKLASFTQKARRVEQID